MFMASFYFKDNLSGYNLAKHFTVQKNQLCPEICVSRIEYFYGNDFI